MARIRKIMPYQPIVLDPSAMVFHYGQEMFEGMKAYKCADGRIRLFRPNKNIERANNSNRRLCIPEIPADDFLNAIKTLVAVDAIGFRTVPALLFIFVRSSLQRIRSSAYARRTPINSSSFFPRRRLHRERPRPCKDLDEDDYVTCSPWRHRRSKDRRQLRCKPRGTGKGTRRRLLSGSVARRC